MSTTKSDLLYRSPVAGLSFRFPERFLEAFMTVTSGSMLSDALLQACRSRAAGYDRDNRFCQEDFDELKAAGYLKLTLPQEFGGLGYTLNPYTREARRLANYAPATALCLNMHHYWVGTAADSWRAGDKSVGFILEDAAKGEVFAAGHAESGNETSIVMSVTKAEKVPGGYKFTGRKSFGSLTPVWTRLGLHGLDTSDPAAPKVVHALLPRDADNFSIKETWDVLGMRATRRTIPCSTARSSLTSTSLGSSRWDLPVPISSCSRSSPGRWSDSGTSTTAWPAACWSLRSIWSSPA